MRQAVQNLRNDNSRCTVNIPIGFKKMRGYQTVPSEKINKRQCLNNGRRNQGHHDDISEKRFSSHCRPGHGVSKKENQNRNYDCRGYRDIETMPKGI